jgi:hypothetical protein
LGSANCSSSAASDQAANTAHKSATAARAVNVVEH